MQTRPGWLMTLWERRPLWMTVLFALILVAAAAVANAETRDLRFDPTGLTRVVLDIDAGDVTLGNGDELSLLIDDTEAGDDCEVTVERDGDVLRLHAGSVGRPSRTDCRVDVTVHVPLPLIIEASVGAGDVTLDDVGLDTGE